MKKDKTLLIMFAITTLAPFSINAKDTNHEIHHSVADNVISEQRALLEKNTKGAGFGPQSPRDIDTYTGNNSRLFNTAPVSTEMNLCNIHLHKNAEHKGGEFTQYAGNGDGHGFQSGFKYAAKLSKAELKPIADKACPSKHSGLSSGDTIEVHYVFSTAKIKPGPTLGSCLNDTIKNPQLRVETQVYVLVNDKSALDFGNLTKHSQIKGLHQAENIPSNTGTPIQYAGSTTGPKYNEKGSPFQVTWSVRPKVAKVNIASVNDWCKGNVFDENHAHGVRNLVMNPDLLSTISK
jgi:hypothetical protein